MAAPVYSKALVSLASFVGTFDATVPAGRTWIIRDIDAREDTGSATAFLFVKNVAGGILWIHQVGSAINDSNAEWRGRQVFPSGSVLELQASGGSWGIQVSGYDLSS